MCSAEEEDPALGHAGAAAQDGQEPSEQGPAAHSAPRKEMWNPLPVHSPAIYGGMKLDGSFSFPLLGGIGIRKGFLLRKLFAGSDTTGMANPLYLQHLQHPHTREETSHRLLGTYPDVSTPGQPRKSPGKVEEMLRGLSLVFQCLPSLPPLQQGLSKPLIQNRQRSTLIFCLCLMLFTSGARQ